jgi:hypothetical protein
MSIIKLPYIALDANITRDEYFKFCIGNVRVYQAEIINVVSDSKIYKKNICGLNFKTSKWVPQMKDKIYFMKGCTVPRIKLKELSVKYQIRTTTNLNDATIVVGSDSAGEKLFKFEWKYKVSAKVFFATIEALKELSFDFCTEEIDDVLTNFNKDELVEIGVDWRTFQLCNPGTTNNGPLANKIYEKLNLTSSQYISSELHHLARNVNVCTISNANLDLYDKIKTKNIIEQNTLLEVVNGDEAVLIDLDTYQNLRNMFKSSDYDNHVMAMEIMANSNYLDSLLFLEMLFFHHNAQIDNSKTKNHVNFKSLKNYLNRGVYSNNHIDDIFRSLLSFDKLDQNALNFIMDDQKDYFENNGYSDYIKPIAYGINLEYQQQLNYKWIHKTEAFIDETTVSVVKKEEVVEDTVEEVTVSEVPTAETGLLPHPETEETETETEKEATEEVLITEKPEEKDEKEFDWF